MQTTFSNILFHYPTHHVLSLHEIEFYLTYSGFSDMGMAYVSPLGLPASSRGILAILAVRRASGITTITRLPVGHLFLVTTGTAVVRSQRSSCDLHLSVPLVCHALFFVGTYFTYFCAARL